MHRIVLYIALLALLPAHLAARGTYQEPQAFLEETFTDGVPNAAVVWLTGERKQRVRALLGHPYPSLRVRYWAKQGRSAWILEEIGKDQPITVGLVVNRGLIERIRVLVFRESRGSEIRYPFFTDQFKGIGLTKAHALDRAIDGISGATLSVRAMKKLAALALYLDGQVETRRVTSSP